MGRRYSAEIAGGSLKIQESRIIADLLLQGLAEEGWRKALLEDNVLQTRSSHTAQRVGSMIRRRLLTMTEPLWKLVRDGVGATAAHACLAATIKHSPILGDFMNSVVRTEIRAHATHLSYRLWEPYLESCYAQDPEMKSLSSTTSRRVRSSVYQILAQAGYLENTRSLKLQVVHVDGQVVHYLQDQAETYALRCMQVTS